MTNRLDYIDFHTSTRGELQEELEGLSFSNSEYTANKELESSKTTGIDGLHGVMVSHNHIKPSPVNKEPINEHYSEIDTPDIDFNLETER